jgi:hypothetical protein
MYAQPLTPTLLSKPVPAAGIPSMPAYDWKRQMRGDAAMQMAGNHTNNSVQTFNVLGQPVDSNNDTND